MILRRIGLVIVAALAALVSTAAAQAQTPIGTAVGVIPAARSEFGGTEVTILTGASLFAGQTIVTDAAGEVQIIFADETRMVIGPNSSMVIETYLMRNPTTLENLTVNALGGTFRFITGNGAHDAYHIQTPAGTIAVRGTALDFTISWLTGQLSVFLFEGSIVICPLVGACVVVDTTCVAGTITNATLALLVTEAAELFDMIVTEFPMVIDQSRLFNEFTLDAVDDCVDQIRQALEVVVPLLKPISPA